MSKLTKLPDLARSARLLKIRMDLEDVPPINLIQIAIKSYLQEDKIMGCLQFIMEGVTDNKRLMVEAIGEDLVKRIIDFMPDYGSTGAMAE